MINILIPVKAFKNSKNRLSNSLSNNQRITASKNLINSLSQNFIKLDQKVTIVTDDKDLKIKNTEIFFTKSALNDALGEAINSISHQDNFVIIMHADLPLVVSTDLTELISLADKNIPFIVPDRHISGTNALGLPIKKIDDLFFGKDSFKKFTDYFSNINQELTVIKNSNIALAKELNELNISIGVGDFYAVRLLEALDVDTHEGVVRLSFVHYTSGSDVEKLISGLDRMVFQ